MSELFVTCAQGLEPLLQAELAELGIPQTTLGFRGVSLEGDLTAVYKINYSSRIASRVLLPLRRFNCFNAKSLYSEISEINWLEFIAEGKTFAIDPNVSHPRLRNSLYAAQVVKDAICDQFRKKTGSRPNVNPKNPDVQLNLFIRDSQGIIYFDTSGSPLTKRGYRVEGVEAPLHETLAAALLRIAKYEPSVILCDPCCGSGTFLIEAALMATNTPPGYLRTRWGFKGLPEFEESAWLKVKEAADREKCALKPGHFMGCDNNKNAVRITRGNIKEAGFHPLIDVVVSDFRDYSPPIPPNFFITNPPHGRRLGDEESLRPLYRALGDFFKSKSVKPAKGFLFTGSFELSKEVGLSPKQRHVMDNSGVDSRFLEFDLF